MKTALTILAVAVLAAYAAQTVNRAIDKAAWDFAWYEQLEEIK